MTLLGTLVAKMLQVTLSSCGNVQPSTWVMLQDVSPYFVNYDYDMFRLMLARHGCRTMLRDEAAKDPRKISFFSR